MSKELEALERIKNIELSHFSYDSDENLYGELEYTPVDVSDGTIEENYPEEIKIIETVIKNNDEEKFDLIKQVRELKDENASLNIFNDKLWVEKQDNEKKLKALEIIKEKRVNIGLFLIGYKDLDYRNYKEHLDLGFQIIKQVSEKPLTQEEYDLLKEVLL